jgi:hypothetical protein
MAKAVQEWVAGVSGTVARLELLVGLPPGSAVWSRRFRPAPYPGQLRLACRPRDLVHATVRVDQQDLDAAEVRLEGRQGVPTQPRPRRMGDPGGSTT